MQLGSIRPGALKVIPIFQQVHLVAIATVCVLENANIFVIISPQRRFPTSIMLVVDVSTKVLLSVIPINPPSQDFALYFFFRLQIYKHEPPKLAYKRGPLKSASDLIS